MAGRREDDPVWSTSGAVGDEGVLRARIGGFLVDRLFTTPSGTSPASENALHNALKNEKPKEEIIGLITPAHV